VGYGLRFAPRDPEAAFVGEIAYGVVLAGDLRAHGVEGMAPAGDRKILEDFRAVGEMHEGAAGGVGEVAVAEFDEAGIMLAARPTRGFEPPESAFGGRRVAVVRGEEEERRGAADALQFAQRGAAIGSVGNLHEAIEREESAGKPAVAQGERAPSRRLADRANRRGKF